MPPPLSLMIKSHHLSPFRPQARGNHNVNKGDTGKVHVSKFSRNGTASDEKASHLPPPPLLCQSPGPSFPNSTKICRTCSVYLPVTPPFPPALLSPSMSAITAIVLLDYTSTFDLPLQRDNNGVLP